MNDEVGSHPKVDPFEHFLSVVSKERNMDKLDTAFPENPLQKKEHYIFHDVLTSVPILAFDLIAIVIACGISSSIQYFLFDHGSVFDYSSLLIALILFPTAFLLMGTYPGVSVIATDELANVFKATTVASLGMMAYLLASGASDAVQVILAYSFFVFPLLVLVPLGRSLSRKIGSKFHWWRQPTLIVGSDASAMRIAYWLEDAPELGLRPILAREASRYEHTHPSRVIIVPTPGVFNDDLLWQFPRAAILSTDDVFRATTAPDRIAALSSIKTQNRLLNPFNRILKRSMDLLVATCVLFLTLPLMLLIVILLKFSDRGPVFYGHQRFGRNGKAFKIWKFRTMHVDAEQVLAKHLQNDPELRKEWEANKKLLRDPRVHPVGRLLRKTSLDELPQLWNIIVGEMSLVGPRPILMEEREQYSDVFPLYALVRPGITGLWQVSGRNNTVYSDRLGYCRYYVLNWSIWLDMLILSRTIKTALLCEGAC
jgi:exopolysaccharide biosynthesis polyprenyl glycosylphosphotransferase